MSVQLVLILGAVDSFNVHDAYDSEIIKVNFNFIFTRINYFRVQISEHKRLADNYIAEGCIIRKGIIGNRTCDISVSPAQLDISMVPCNFIPIQPQLYTGK